MSQAASDDSFDAADDLAKMEWDEEALAEMERVATQPSSPVKQWRSPEAVDSPSTPESKQRHGLQLGNETPATPSRPSGRKTTLEEVTIDDEPSLHRALSNGSQAELRLLPSRSMAPPPVPTNTRPLRSSSTYSSIDSTSSSNSLFSATSRTSSMSSMESANTSPQNSPLKRGAEDQLISSPSPSKSRKLCATPGSNPSSNSAMESPLASPSKSRPSANTFTLEELFAGKHGCSLPKYIVAHSKKVLHALEGQGVTLGVQWELARGVSAGKFSWENIETKMKKTADAFAGTNLEVAWKVSDIMRGITGSDPHDRDLWSEVDREHAAFMENKGRGLGLLDGPWPHWKGDTAYYGGRVEYPLRLYKTASVEDPYNIRIEKPRIGRSHRFARDLGSPSVLHLSIPTKLVQDEGEHIRRFLAQRFIVNGRVYLAIPPKDTTSVYLIQTNEDYEREPLRWYGDQYRMSFDDFIRRHNPLHLNSEQSFAKYTARFALGLSTSIPVLEFEEHNILELPDIVTPDWPPDVKPPADKIFSDGAGLINDAALVIITKRLGFAQRLTAVQGRCGGYKGLWSRHPYDNSKVPTLYVRPSQLKIKLDGHHRVHRIFDFLRGSRPSATSSRQKISEQAVLCLSHNGIPDETLVSLMVDGLEASVKPLLSWAPGVELSLWREIDGSGAVSSTRMQRIAKGKSRALGFGDREPDEVDEELDVAMLDSESATSTLPGRDIALGPLSLHERAMELLQSGFHRSTSEYLTDKMRLIIKTEINAITSKYKVTLPESTASEAFVIPDPLSVLEEGQIFYRSSNGIKDPLTETKYNTVIGDLIVPNASPCDMQKVTAVDIPELHPWTDVVITSNRGQQSLLSLLSGGDTVIFIWMEELVKQFGPNKPLTPVPEGFMGHFNQEVKTVRQVGDELGAMNTEEAQRRLQDYLLDGLRDSQVGQYSWFHDISIYRHGYGDIKSILMAYIGNILLDAGKSGLSLKAGIYEAHKKVFGQPQPKKGHNWSELSRDSYDPFILESLFVAGKQKGDELLREHDLAAGMLPETFKKFSKDPDLVQPYQFSQKKAQGDAAWVEFYKSELNKIEDHVKRAHEEFCRIRPTMEDKKKSAMIRAVQEKFSDPIAGIELMSPDEVTQVKASYAYALSTKEDFGFCVAFGTLCHIKAWATTGSGAPVSRLFDESKSISGAAARATLDDDDL
ncbi:RNA-dependent RNA polymerase [Favolaschia claudopus]|uniref:RNA-dependent RNA polymerase n=1 Tax=Favolaschia claudopus TaxID=2862362 RepID=A0AAW0EHA7_9AGAR